MNRGQFVTADGIFWGIDNDAGAPVTQVLLITVDVNGYKKKPNQFGKDTFMFEILKPDYKLVPMGMEGTVLPAATYCDRNNDLPTYNQGLGCMYYVMTGTDY
ncbi:MAG: hypothetical protein PHC64_08890 [Candidatus Gastranaerophilales bacterium]|nr:hypothetical protein [Candidatus Gastranaerophilales bacterium]